MLVNFTAMITLAKDEIIASLPFDKGEGGTEWLETNGLGGWSGSTISGCNSRRYHGLLVAATAPPTERMNLVSKLDETIIINNERFDLSTNNYGSVISPAGYNYLSSFTKDLFSSWIYEAANIRLKKTVAMVYNENTIVVMYDVLKAAGPFTMQLLPLISVRGYHNLMHANKAINTNAVFQNDTLELQAYSGTPAVFIKTPGATFTHQPYWFYNFNYTVEKARGLDFTEDLFSHGHFTVELKEGDSLGIIVSTEDTAEKDAHKLFAGEKARRAGLVEKLPGSFLERLFTLAADQFIVKRGNDLKTVIAGYHWFTDWARDTMISLPGLCLCTGRFEDAKKIIAAFAHSVSMGMLPNRFMDNNEPPEYNNVDGTLWYFIAIYKYLQATNDKDFVLGEILPVLKEIVDWHFKGTRYNIHVAEDGLLYAGENGQQLTWMDARVGDWVVTPRMGKPVEIQALWYNALRIFAELLALNGQEQDAAVVNISADKVKTSFAEQFWYEKGGYLYDVIDENGEPGTSLRPNQLFAISLPFALIDGDKAEAMLNVVTHHLYTPVGLRSLSPLDSSYIGMYSGNQLQRDSAYHQGTVWTWLLGPYIDAVIKVHGHCATVTAIIDAFKQHFKDDCIGSVPEIFDGDAPHHPRGCVAQAWSVAEMLRVIKEYNI
ncbi:MAG TPA: amylo-alpha-1,6-glucosidase [Chitinophagaceae bacterium]|nr:amylo-alpha-1,6-glucosidase [Chitinophagaceae bacterium]